MEPKTHILLVEDLAVIQHAVQNILNHFNIELTSVSNAEDALKVLENNAFDLILMDIGLPDMKGHELTKVIRQNEHKAKTYTPIVALTANHNPDDHKDYIAAGMEEVMIKPISIDKMRAIVNRYIPKITH